VKEINDKTPVVIDSDDLIQHPQATIKAYCDAVGISFIPEALTWKINPNKTHFSHWDKGVTKLLLEN